MINDFLFEMALSKEDIVCIKMDFSNSDVDYIAAYIFYEDRSYLD